MEVALLSLVAPLPSKASAGVLLCSLVTVVLLPPGQALCLFSLGPQALETQARCCWQPVKPLLAVALFVSLPVMLESLVAVLTCHPVTLVRAPASEAI